MPKTFHFKTTFDTKLVLQDSDLAAIEKGLAAIDNGEDNAEKARTGCGKFLDERIAMMARAQLRGGVAFLLEEESSEAYTHSPAKVTQVVIPRIEKASQCATCTGGYCPNPDCTN